MNFINSFTNNCMIATAYVATAFIGFSLAIHPGNITVVWPPSGISLAAALLLGNRIWPGIWIGSFATNAIFFQTGSSLGFQEITSSIVIATGSTLQALFGAYFISRWIGRTRVLETPWSILRFVGVEFVVCSIAATFGVSSMAYFSIVPPINYSHSWLTWWIGDLSGVIIFAPFLLSWLQRPRWKASFSRFIEAAILTLGLAGTAFLIFSPSFPIGQNHFNLTFLTFPFLLWGAFRFGQRGISVICLIYCIISLWGTAQGAGPFINDSAPLSLLLVQCFLTVITMCALSVAAVFMERLRIEGDLEQSRESLEVKVRERTAELRIATEKLRMSNEKERRRIGRELHDGLGQQITGVLFLCEVLKKKFNLCGQKEKREEEKILDQVKELLNKALREVRDLVRSVSAADVCEGLDSALEKLARQTEQLFRIRCIYAPAPNLPQIDDERAMQLYRIAQEAVTNAVKHGKCSKITLSLHQGKEKMILEVSDDGIGFEKNRFSSKGMGLQNMKDRAKILGASLVVHSMPNEGTSVSCILEISEREKVLV